MATKLFDCWNVQLAKTYEPGMIKEGEWFSISQKINGSRATYFVGEMVSRTGNKIEGMKHIIDDLKALEKHLGMRYSFDGELRLRDEFGKGMTDNEAFKFGTGIANSTRDMSKKYMLKFIIFDIIPMKDWQYDWCEDTYKKRLELLKEVHNIIQRFSLYSLDTVKIVYSGTDLNEIEYCLIDANNNGWEGIMINRDMRYQFKRTNAILKYKSFNTIDLECIGMVEGTGKYEGTLGALCCKYGDNVVYVGTGFTDSLRNYIWNLGSWINGKIIEVKYKDITSDSVTGLKSLQFPVFVQIRQDKDSSDA